MSGPRVSSSPVWSEPHYEPPPDLLRAPSNPPPDLTESTEILGRSVRDSRYREPTGGERFPDVWQAH
eukprot:6069865-Pyramimonas_sp.AAC.2